MQRRQVIVAGIASTAAAIGVAYVLTPHDVVDKNNVDLLFLNRHDQVILSALLPVLLAGYIDPSAPFPAALNTKISVTVDQAIALQLPRIQAELRQLFSLLEVNIARVVLTHQLANWNELDGAAKQQMLLSWRDSALTLLQIAYSGLHDLVIAAYYTDNTYWQAIGYEPPAAIRG